MMGNTLHEVIGLVYETALDDSLWTSTMGRVAEMVGAAEAALVGYDLQQPRLDFAVGSRRVFDDDFQRRYDEHWLPRDISIQALIARPPTVLYESRELLPAEVDRGSSIHNELFVPLDLSVRSAGLIEPPEGGRLSVFCLHRRNGREGFDRQERALVEALFPHVRRALQIRRHIAAEHARASDLLAAIDNLPIGVIITDASGRVREMNTVARRIVAAGDGLSVDRHGQCRATTPDATLALHRLVGQAAATAAGTGIEAGGALALPRTPPKEPLAALVAPLRCGETSDGKPVRSGVALLVRNPGGDTPTPARLLSALYGLTPREAALAGELLTGRSVAEAADRLGLTTDSARVYLKRVFNKTGVSRQGELIVLLLRGPIGWLGQQAR